MPNQDIELRSEEVQEILTRVPHWMIRWGNVIILIILLMIFLLAWIIKYPDIVTTDITITTLTPPEKLIARSSGRLEKILVINQQNINKHTPLAVIENTANYEDVFYLKSITDTLKVNNVHFEFPFEKLRGLQLGDIGAAFTVFEKDYIAYTLNNNLQPYSVEGNAQSYEIVQLKQRLSLLVEQKEIADKEIVIKKNEISRYQKLYDKGVIATQEWDTKNLDYLQFEKGLRNLNASISQTKSSINDLDKNTKTTRINETKDEVNLFRNTIQSYSQLKKVIGDWELAYVLRSSIAGEVSFLQVWKENQSVTSGDNIFTVIPRNETNYIGKVKAIAQNSGKLKQGQKVNIRLANYPDREFGVLNGNVENISLTPDKEGNLLIDVSLPEGLNTSYNKKIYFQQEMTGTADIVTEDLRLIERLLYQFRDIFSRSNTLKKETKESANK
ncbi:HlyD family efflux transporter periplasmic adaptor subunit [Flavobacterium sp. LS1R49]|uniref:HlyD family efflux transporter periplasmic adaptor subunit n=1 Tax=Flavobacterium shii TaxID=2987687 RepID=A0A9X2YT49_9FLAO|nr:HlyD family secretion protein [Flavobacterium shii]MCV9926268.1 HlyD family efflux transporter periplasmic adaptor subunit [Flavobacterium shii]